VPRCQLRTTPSETPTVNAVIECNPDTVTDRECILKQRRAAEAALGLARWTLAHPGIADVHDIMDPFKLCHGESERSPEAETGGILCAKPRPLVRRLGAQRAPAMQTREPRTPCALRLRKLGPRPDVPSPLRVVGTLSWCVLWYRDP